MYSEVEWKRDGIVCGEELDSFNFGNNSQIAVVWEKKRTRAVLLYHPESRCFYLSPDNGCLNLSSDNGFCFLFSPNNTRSHIPSQTKHFFVSFQTTAVFEVSYLKRKKRIPYRITLF